MNAEASKSLILPKPNGSTDAEKGPLPNLPGAPPRRAKFKPGKLRKKAYEKAMQKLQAELCHLQDWVRESGARVVIVLEGRDTAGKGGPLKRINERGRPPRFRLFAPSAPGGRGRSKIYLQRHNQTF